MILAWLSGAFIAGVAVGTSLPAMPVPAASCAVVLIATAVLGRRHRSLVVLALLLAALLLGIARSPHKARPTILDLAYYNSRYVQVHGVIDAEPDIRDTGANYRVRVDAVIIGGIPRHVHGQLSLHTSKAVEVEYGHAVTVTGRLLTPGHGIVRGADSEVRFPRMIDDGPITGGWLSWVIPLRTHLERGIERWLPEPEAALLIAITLGARSASLGDLAPPLVATGLIHLIAISGIKVALVAGTVNQLARVSGSRAIRLAASLVVLFTYVVLTGVTASGVRSAGMWTLVFIAVYLGRPTVALVSLGFVAALMLAQDPSLLTDIGFILSTVGTLSIVAFTHRILHPLRWLVSPFREALSVTIAAQFGTVPVVTIGFGLVSLSGPIANMVVLPFLPALIVLGFTLGACASLAAIAAPMSALAYALLHSVVLFAIALPGLPGALHTGKLSVFGTAAYYTALVGLGIWTLRRAKWVPVGSPPVLKRELMLTVVAGSTLLTASLALARTESRPALYWAGSDDAFVLRSGTMTALIGGSTHTRTLLRRIGGLMSYTSRAIDVIVVTDPRSGPVSGLREVLRRYAVSSVLDVGSQYPSSTYARWRADLRGNHTPVYAARTGASVSLGDAHIDIIGPDDVCARSQDCGGIVRVTIPGRTVVLALWASLRQQHEVVFRGIQTAGNILVCGRQGCDGAFQSTVNASHVIASAGLPADRPVEIGGVRSR